MGLVDQTVKRSKPLRRGEIIFEAGADFKSIYAVRSGALKSYSINEKGDEQVFGFFLPGELLGLDAIDTSTHVSSAMTLENSAICEIPFHVVESLSQLIQSLQSQMYRLLSREIRRDQELQILLGKKTAEEKMSAFFLNLSLRYEQRKLSPFRFRLPMARVDIGNYLGLAVETVSRVITRLQNDCILCVDGKEVEILDRRRLCEAAHDECVNL